MDLSRLAMPDNPSFQFPAAITEIHIFPFDRINLCGAGNGSKAGKGSVNRAF